jgi:hypothetical protein
MIIDVKPLRKKASCSSRNNFDGAANATDFTEPHPAKHPSQTHSIVGPIVTSSRGAKLRIRKRPELSVRIWSVIQKLIGNDENMIDPFSKA